MDSETRQRREATIHEAAYALLAEHGYGGTSMLRVARAAKASNETMYRWYGDKDGLFAAMVRANATQTRDLLETALKDEGDPWQVLATFAPVFLRMVLGDRAILLNRVAAADAGGSLGAAISAGGRNAVTPLLQQVMGRICANTECDPAQATGWFLAHLLGDWQVRRIIHDCPAPSEAQIAERCDQAITSLRHLLR